MGELEHPKIKTRDQLTRSLRVWWVSVWFRGDGIPIYIKHNTYLVIFYVVYYILNSGGFVVSCFRPSWTVSRDSMSWTDTYTVEVSTTDDLFHTLKTMWGPVSLRSVTDSTEQLVWGLMHLWSMLHVISVMCCLNRISTCTSYYCELVVGRRTQFYILLEVWGHWELGCWHLMSE